MLWKDGGAQQHDRDDEIPEFKNEDLCLFRVKTRPMAALSLDDISMSERRAKRKLCMVGKLLQA